MAQNTTLTIPTETWTLITDSNVTAITFQNVGDVTLELKATVGTTPPANRLGSIKYLPGQGERNAALADLFLGIAGANRIYVFCERSTDVMISHA